MKMVERYRVGFVYNLKCMRGNRTIWEETVHNIIPSAGIDYIVGAAMNGVAQVSSWFIGISETSYAPIASDTMTTLLTNAPESQAYSSTTRVQLIADAIASGTYVNTSSPAFLDFTVDATVRLVFISSSAVQLSTSGLLVSAVALPSPKICQAGDSLKIITGLQLQAA